MALQQSYLLYGPMSASRHSPTDAPGKTPNKKELNQSISANPWHRSGYLQSTCKPLTPVRIRKNKTGHTSRVNTLQKVTCRYQTQHVAMRPSEWYTYYLYRKSSFICKIPSFCLNWESNQVSQVQGSLYPPPSHHSTPCELTRLTHKTAYSIQIVSSYTIQKAAW